MLYCFELRLREVVFWGDGWVSVREQCFLSAYAHGEDGTVFRWNLLREKGVNVARTGEEVQVRIGNVEAALGLSAVDVDDLNLVLWKYRWNTK